MNKMNHVNDNVNIDHNNTNNIDNNSNEEQQWGNNNVKFIKE